VSTTYPAREPRECEAGVWSQTSERLEAAQNRIVKNATETSPPRGETRPSREIRRAPSGAPRARELPGVLIYPRQQAQHSISLQPPSGFTCVPVRPSSPAKIECSTHCTAQYRLSSPNGLSPPSPVPPPRTRPAIPHLPIPTSHNVTSRVNAAPSKRHIHTHKHTHRWATSTNTSSPPTRRTKTTKSLTDRQARKKTRYARYTSRCTRPSTRREYCTYMRSSACVSRTRRGMDG
jgi:hypothetical protein